MTETRNAEQLRRNMAAVRAKDTAPELRLRRALHQAGIRGWRKHYGAVIGRPDLAWPALRVAVFVDGAFWHGHPSKFRPGKSGVYWDSKIRRNIERDQEVNAVLCDAGWTVIRIWDFEVLRELGTALNTIIEVLRSELPPQAKPRWQQALIASDSRLPVAQAARVLVASPSSVSMPRPRISASFGGTASPTTR